MKRIIIASAVFLFTSLLFTSLLMAATPPPLMNYEGVLRNSANAPLSGSFDMVFRFMDPLNSEVLVDSHTASSGGQVSVTGGLFNVQLGGGTVTDGTGPGVYTSLDQVFRDYGTLYLQITIGSETLTPPVRIVSAAYALNATNLAGKGANQYLDTSAATQTKSGPLNLISSSPTTALDVTGGEIAGHFLSGPNEAFVGDGSLGRGLAGFGNTGVEGKGSFFGGWFHHENSNGGSVLLGGGTTALVATLNDLSGYVARFTNQASSSDVTIGQQDQYGVRASVTGGIAVSGITPSGTGLSGDGGTGIGVFGTGSEGGSFFSNTSSSYGRVGTSTYKIQGSGAVSFVQNHPFDKGKVIVYASPEGDEVGVYTRGSARLENGEARVALGETFAWVTNPDVGLTAHLTPRGRWSQLYVESVSPTELVVKSAGGDPAAAFDYVVQGLRIGFEEVSIVQEKQRESYIPSMAEHRQRYAQHPELRAYNALERFKAMPAAAGTDGTGASAAAESAESASIDGSRARALKSAIHEYDPSADGPVVGLAGFAAVAGTHRTVSDPVRPIDSGASRGAAERGSKPAEGADVDVRDLNDRMQPVADGARETDVDRAVMLPVSGIVEPGDVLVVDIESAGSVRRGFSAADPSVIGVAAGRAFDGQSAVLTSGVVLCKVDASYGSIRPGDLLTASPTPGHAMRRTDAPSGTILGKALERLDDGTGVIKILLTLQ